MRRSLPNVEMSFVSHVVDSVMTRTSKQVSKKFFKNFQGMGVFSIVWLGQLVSIVGSELTRFALGLWVYQQTGSVTQFAFIALCSILPHLFLSPLAGVLIDRWDRRGLMLLSDLGAACSTVILAAFFFTNRLELWHIYLLTTLSASCDTFQGPAYAASIALLVPKKHLGRANGMVQFGQAVSGILAPLLAGVLMITVRLWGIFLIDAISFLLAVSSLLLVRFPSHKAAMKVDEEKTSVYHEAKYGWQYIAARPGLLGLLIFLVLVNFLWGMVGALITPMILNFTSADRLGMIISIAGGGMLFGSLIMSFWGGPQKRVSGVLNFELLSGVCFLLIGLRPSFTLVALGVFGAHLTIAIVNGSEQAIWQAKVEPKLQGRVFAMRQMISKSSRPLAYLLAGPLADRIFEPLLTPQGALAGSLGQILGTGPGRGIACLFLVMGFLKILVSLGGWFYPRVRRVEEELPDTVPEQIVTV